MSRDDIRAMRLAAEMSQTDWAKFLGVDVRTVRRWERKGSVRPPWLDSWARLWDAVGQRRVLVIDNWRAGL